jgi:hypothetical protein
MNWFDEWGALIGLALSLVLFGIGVKLREIWLYRQWKKTQPPDES